MDPDLHLIGKLDVQAVVPDEDMAHALRPRLEALGWRLMPRVIERVLDEALPPDVHVRLERLDLDLGTLGPDHLEHDALQALEGALSEALATALHAARQLPGQGGSLLDAGDWRMARMTAYLLSGTLPFMSRARPFDAAAQLVELVARRPEAFKAWLRRHAHQRHILSRLVMQADADGLRALLALLAPSDDAVIHALLADVLVAHARTPLPRPLGRSELARLLWVATLEFLLHDGGAAFHRTRYLGHLLEREAVRMGVGYRDLLVLLSATVAAMSRRTALRSPLPAALAELVSALPEPPLSSFWEAARLPDMRWTQALACAGRGWFEPLMAQARDPLAPPARLEGVAQRMGQALLGRLLRERMPHEADGVLADMRACLAGSKIRDGQWLLWACVLRWMAGGADDDGDMKAGPSAGRRWRLGLRAHWQAAMASRADDPGLNLRQWLHAGAAVRPGTLRPSPAEYLLALPAPQIRRLLRSANAAHVRARLRRVMAGLKPTQRLLLLDKLEAPGGGPRAGLPPAWRTLGQAGRFEWLLKAADAALAGSPRPDPPDDRRTSTRATPQRALEDRAGRPQSDLIDLLEQGGPLAPAWLGRLVAWLDADDAELLRHFMSGRGRRAAHARWARHLPPSVLRRVLALWHPELAPALATALPVMQQAFRDTASFATRRQVGPVFWRALLDLLCAPRAPGLADLVETLLAWWSEGQAPQAAKLRARAVQLARRGGHGPLADVLRGEAGQAVALRKPAASPPSRTEAPRHALYVGNAGLVLCQPFLPTLFERLGLLTPDERGVPRVQGEDDASRACHLLQYLAEGRLDQDEPRLLLNKLLAGLPPSQPVARLHDATPEELAICDDLMRAVAGNWPALSNTTPPVLRETFLQREGRLLRKAESWTLHVQRKTVDVLVDRCPWPFSLVYHPWMPDPIHVTW